ncbi:N-acetylmuramoyl-L-alanine amidase [Williamsia sterculiae]|uniref:N-acetylmuramoyl-L-alanine amidase n=1 Tax=Williamsia sterculiae TaxID=1344003 RepID=A0A1N7FU76_9NOCA|nr:N-acetylmuramoyl-L-alanine amidase [Williamsia sterculiae]SIS03933.1 N-acetylmuramoyl-L-alanine amidase [Williamsia sterculiae]
MSKAPRTRVTVLAGSACLAAVAPLLIAPGSASAAPTTSTPSAPATAAPAAKGTALTGKTVFLDPGHQGGSAGQKLDKKVPDGRGGTKDCQTTGATSVNGVPEHTVNWDVTQLVKAGLESQGAKVLLSRQNDTGWGGCVDERAKAATASKADVAVNIHADSTSASADPSKSGFHVIVPQLPIPDANVNKVQSTTGLAASKVMRDAFKKTGFTPANYAGVVDGLQTRSDIAAVNLTGVPDVFIEMGNLANPTEAAQLTGKDGQLKYALAITDGIVQQVVGQKATASTTAPTTTTPSTSSPSLPQGQSVPGTTGTTGTTTAPSTGTSQSGIDVTGLKSVIPLVQELMKSKNPNAIAGVLAGEGQDTSSQVLKAMLSVLYSAFGGKLPI